MARVRIQDEQDDTVANLDLLWYKALGYMKPGETILKVIFLF